MPRVARRVVVFNFGAEHVGEFWLTRDYLPGFAQLASGHPTTTQRGGDRSHAPTGAGPVGLRGRTLSSVLAQTCPAGGVDHHDLLIQRCLNTSRTMRAPSVPAAPVITPFVIVVPCSAPNFWPSHNRTCCRIEPFTESPVISRGVIGTLGEANGKATGETATTLAFAQNSFVFSTCYFLSLETLGNDTVEAASSGITASTRPAPVRSFTSSSSQCGWIIARSTIHQRCMFTLADRA